MSSLTQHTRGGYYLEVRPRPNARKMVYLGVVSKKQAETIRDNVDRLLIAQRINIPDQQMDLWLMGIDKDLKDKLRKAGLKIPEAVKAWTVKAWVDHVADNYPGAPRTRTNVKGAAKHWISMLGPKSLDKVTMADCRKSIETLRAANQPSHAVRLCESGRMFFERAVEAKLITENPFAKLKFGDKMHDKTRQNYITLTAFNQVMKAATCNHSRALFALARYCGLRVPSEPLALRITDLDWDLSRISVPNDTKTGSRTLPMLQAEPYLRALVEEHPDGTTMLFTRARSSAATTYREWLLAAIRSAKLEPWPKLWVNLRASCRTDLADLYPAAVCDHWLGHSTRVARNHYELVKPEHWDQAKRTGAFSSALGSALGRNVSEGVCGGQ